MYTDLATILSDTDWVRIDTITKTKGLTAVAWVGLYNDVTSWRWSLNELPLKNLTYVYWYPGEPNNLSGKESCVSISPDNYWKDRPCTELKPFICYSGELISCFHIFFVEMSADRDKNACCSFIYSFVCIYLTISQLAKLPGSLP